MGEPEFEEYIADDGDQCDACGKRMAEGDRFLSNPKVRVSWRFCSKTCAGVGVTEKSRKGRFLGFVLGKP